MRVGMYIYMGFVLAQDMVGLGELSGDFADLVEHKVGVLNYHVLAERELVQGGLKAGAQRVKGGPE